MEFFCIGTLEMHSNGFDIDKNMPNRRNDAKPMTIIAISVSCEGMIQIGLDTLDERTV